jgi:hypothetical protein
MSNTPTYYNTCELLNNLLLLYMLKSKGFGSKVKQYKTIVSFLSYDEI